MFEHCYALTTWLPCGMVRAVLVDQTITYLEMTSSDQLRAGRVPPAEVTIDSVDATALVLIRSTHDRIATPHHWSSLDWTEQQWSDLLARPGVRSWIARVGVDVIGLVQLEIHPGTDVEIIKFGLVPEFVGRGFGGHVLTVATRLAWDVGGVSRVWLHTSSFDHPHALHNYRSRGFRQFQVVHRPREMPG
ncbi:MAG: GNAT family N-acetyltransferase [Actinomycetota bacterium]|nr:GNAT family N-acetyltransferase [Actinomycetota bacterium]